MSEYTRLIPEYSGVSIVYCTCSNCKQTMTYPTDKAYNHCPYCGKRVKYDEQKEADSGTR